MDQTVADVIRAKYPAMTKKQRLLADYMLEHSEAMSFMTLKELSAETGISEMTILHACTALGYGNYNELKYEFRKYITIQGKIEVQQQDLYSSPGVPEYELDDKRRLLTAIAQEEGNLYRQMFDAMRPEPFFQAAEMLMDASNTIICARGVSLQVAEYLATRLASLSMPSVVVNTELGDNIQSALPLFNSSVLTVAVSLPDYYLMTTRICEYARQRRSRILALTDSPASPVYSYGELTLLAPASTRLFLNTTGPMMSLVNLLTSAVNIEKSARHSTRFNSATEFAQLFAEKGKE